MNRMTEKALKYWLKKKARIVMDIGNATILVIGKIMDIGREWITVETEEGIKTISKSAIVMIEAPNSKNKKRYDDVAL